MTDDEHTAPRGTTYQRTVLRELRELRVSVKELTDISRRCLVVLAVANVGVLVALWMRALGR